MTEWFSTVPDTVVVPEKIEWSGSRIVCDNDTIHAYTLNNLLLSLQCSSEFHNNPTPENLERVAKQLLNDAIDTMRQDGLYYIKHVLPLFLKKELKQ